jgi:hypothetical protein
VKTQQRNAMQTQKKSTQRRNHELQHDHNTDNQQSTIPERNDINKGHNNDNRKQERRTNTRVTSGLTISNNNDRPQQTLATIFAQLQFCEYLAMRTHKEAACPRQYIKITNIRF